MREKFSSRLGSVREFALTSGQQILGHPSQIGGTVLKYVILLSAMGGAAAVWALIIAGISAERGSYGVAAPFFKFATSTWSYVVLELLILRSVLFVSSERKARQAASYLGMGADGVKRLAAEAKSTTGTTRVIATSEDSKTEIAERIREATRGADGDVLRQAGAESNGGAEAPAEHPLEQLKKLHSERQELLRDRDALTELIDAELGDALSADLSLSGTDGETLSPYELMDSDGKESVDSAEALLEELEALEVELREINHDIAILKRYQFNTEAELQAATDSAHALGDALAEAGYEPERSPKAVEVEVDYPSLSAYLRPAALLGGVFGVLGALWNYLPMLLLGLRPLIPDSVKSVFPFGKRAELLALLEGAAGSDAMLWAIGAVVLTLLGGAVLWARAWVSAHTHAKRVMVEGETEVPVDLPEEERGLSWREGWKLWRMDTAARLETQEILWQFLAPAMVATGLLIVAAGIWLRVWIYPLLLAVGVLIGSLNYARISRKRERTLQALRQTDDYEAWDACSLLVKPPVTVETSEMCFAWFNGKGYAHPNADVLAEELAPRVRQLLSGEEISPSVLQKYHRNIRDYYPDLDGWRRNVEEYELARELISQVESAPDGIVPKAKLIEDTVLADKDSMLFGLLESGAGYDPALVRKVYLDLSTCSERDETGHLLVEEEMSVETAHGEEEAVTAVRLQTDPLPPDISEVRANFSNRFKAYAQFEPLYRLPDVDNPQREPLNPEPPQPSETKRQLTYSESTATAVGNSL